MIIDIVGAGSLGLLFYSKMLLQDKKKSLRLWTRTEAQAKLIRENGIHFHPNSQSTGKRIFPHHYADYSVRSLQQSGADSSLPAADAILIMVKQKHITAEFVQSLSLRIKPETIILCFQNGIRTDSLWNKLWQVYVAITTEGAKKISANEVMHSGNGETIIGKLATMPSSSDYDSNNVVINEHASSTMCSLVNCLTQAGLQTSLSNNIEITIYRKLTINAVINPLTALWRISNGELLRSEKRINVMRQLYDEAIYVYDQSGITWSASWWEDILQVCNATAANTSSMLADVLNNQTTEIQWINGTIVELARRQHIRADHHEWISCLIESMTIEEAD